VAGPFNFGGLSFEDLSSRLFSDQQSPILDALVLWSQREQTDLDHL